MIAFSIASAGEFGGTMRAERLPTGYISVAVAAYGDYAHTVIVRAEDAEAFGRALLRIAADVRRPQ